MKIGINIKNENDYTYFSSTLNHSEMSLGLCTEIYNVKSELNDDRLQQANLD